MRRWVWFLVLGSCGTAAVAPQDGPSADGVREGGAADAAPDAGSDGPDACGAIGQFCCTGFVCDRGAFCGGSVCLRAIAPASCPPGALAARFVDETAPPAAMAPWAVALVTLTFANCSGSPWNATAVGAPDGFKLGFAAPRDDDLFGSGRVALPADVPPGNQVTVAVVAQAPPLCGPHEWAWAIVHEGVEWLAGPSPTHTIDVEAAPNSLAICAGVQADVGGGAPASTALQACIDATPAGGTLALPPGIYRVTSDITIAKTLTLRTAGVASEAPACLDGGGPPCAVLRADASLNLPRGFLRLVNTSGVVIDHIVLDGNRAARLASSAAQICASGTNNGVGFNGFTSGCVGCTVVGGGSARALCGTGWEWSGAQATITRNVFRDNGDHFAQNLWSDGLTIGQSDGAVVTANRFIDNTDVNLIVGGNAGGLLQGNSIFQRRQAAFAGLMLDNFNGATSGNFVGTMVSGNAIFCGNLQCDFAIELGPHPWYLSANLVGGTVTGNQAFGGKFNLNVEGGGTATAPMVVSGNTLGPAPTSANFNCGPRTSSVFNVSPDSQVDLGAGPAPTSAITFHNCP